MNKAQIKDTVTSITSGEATVAQVAEANNMNVDDMTSLLLTVLGPAEGAVFCYVHREDMKIKEICNLYVLSTAAFYSLLDATGTPHRNDKSDVAAHSSAQRAAAIANAVARYEKGDKIRDICAEEKIAQPALHCELRRLGIGTRRQKISRKATITGVRLIDADEELG